MKNSLKAPVRLETRNILMSTLFARRYGAKVQVATCQAQGFRAERWCARLDVSSSTPPRAIGADRQTGSARTKDTKVREFYVSTGFGVHMKVEVESCK